MLTTDSAICIRAIDYSETSQIVTLFTRTTGKISAIAKGSKRAKSAFDGPLEIFSAGEIVFSHRENQKLATLTEFEQKPIFAGLRKNLAPLNAALFAAELVNELTGQYDPHKGLFEIFSQFLYDIENVKDNRDVLAFLILFELGLLKEIGSQPILKVCGNCKNEIKKTSNEVYFSSSANGVICRDCEGSFQDKLRLPPKAADCLADFKVIASADKKTLERLEKVLVYHFSELIGKQPKMAKYVLTS